MKRVCTAAAAIFLLSVFGCVHHSDPYDAHYAHGDIVSPRITPDSTNRFEMIVQGYLNGFLKSYPMNFTVDSVRLTIESTGWTRGAAQVRMYSTDGTTLLPTFDFSHDGSYVYTHNYKFKDIPKHIEFDVSEYNGTLKVIVDPLVTP